jgi:DNA-binding CsgD family transcriptional regulator
MVMAGCSNKDIAYRLGISLQTAKWHVANLCVMFRTPNRAGLAAATARLIETARPSSRQSTELQSE